MTHSENCSSRNFGAPCDCERDANQLAADETEHRSSSDYIDRTIETVRNHREADNCWPQWANIFADEIEDLRTDRERLVALVGILQQERDDLDEQWMATCEAREADVRRRAVAAEAALVEANEDLARHATALADGSVALATTRQALTQIAETALWYARNGERLAHEVDHALCVEILSMAEDALTDTGGDTEPGPCDCRANDWTEGDNGVVRCVQCGGYAGEPGTSIGLTEVAGGDTKEPA